MSSFQSDCVVQRGCYSIYTRFRVPKLYRYVHQGQWEKIPKRCKDRPREARFVHRYVPNDTALHRLLRAPDKRSPEYQHFLATADSVLQDEIAMLRLKAVCALVEANPSIVSVPDHFGRTPLHLACMNIEYSKGAAEIMLDACSEAALVRDSCGRAPIDYLLQDQKVAPDLIQKFMSVTSEAESKQWPVKG